MSNDRQASVPHLPRASFKARVIDLALCMTEKEDKEQLAVQFQVTQEGEHLGKFITRYFFFTDAAVEHTFKAMRAMGWKGVDPTDLEPMRNADVIIVTDHEKDEKYGGMRSVVKWVNAIGVAVSKPLEGSRLSQFKSRVSALAAKQANAGGAQTGKLPPIANSDQPPVGEPPPWMRS